MRGVARSLAWSDFFAGEAQALEHPAHRRHAAVDAPVIGETGAQLLSGEIGVIVHQLLDQCGGGGVQGGSLAASMRFGRDVPRRTATA
jgi:hypothetical protein